MPLLNYNQTRPWAKAIRESVATHRMPPWFADPQFGHFANDASLTPLEISTLESWVKNGSPEGDATEKPQHRVWIPGWNIGKPDTVLEMPKPVSIASSAVIEYQYIILPTGFKEDRWVQRVEVRPEARDAVHHAVLYIREPGSDWLRGHEPGVPFSLPAGPGHRPNPLSLTKSDILLVYTPGNNMDSWPEGMAKRIPAGSDIVLQMHYTSKGKRETDRTRIGLAFAKAKPEKVIYTLQISNDRFTIPAGDPNYRVQASGTLPNDALLLGLFPHMHLRGKSFEYKTVAPEGHVHVLLAISKYDFNWQLYYRLTQPMFLPAGTRIVCDAAFDNSPNNHFNPDPTKEVHFGEQIWEEMMIGFFDVAVDSNLSKADYFVRHH